MVICVHPIFKFISGVSAMTTAKPQFDREKILKEDIKINEKIHKLKNELHTLYEL